MALVAGVDCSTQSCKVVIRDADTGELVREGRAAHPDGTEVAPEHWWRALTEAVEGAGGLGDVTALGVGGQQHGMVALDSEGEVVRPALLWNDTRSAPQALRLIDELGGPLPWAQATGSVPVASFTVTKLAWLAENEPDNAARTAAVCLPHDWLTWRLAGGGPGKGISTVTTDRGDASGTGYFDPASDRYRMDLFELGLGHSAEVPRVLPPTVPPGQTDSPSALGSPCRPGPATTLLPLWVSGRYPAMWWSRSGPQAWCQPSARFRPATPEQSTSRAAPMPLDGSCLWWPRSMPHESSAVTATMLGVDLGRLSELALSAPPGSHGVVLVPYLNGERTRTGPMPPARSPDSPPPRHPPSWPGLRSKGSCAGSPTASTPSAARDGGAAGAAHRRWGQVRGAAQNRPGRFRGSGRRTSSGEYVADGGCPTGRLGPRPGQRDRPTGRRPGPRPTRRSRNPRCDCATGKRRSSRSTGPDRAVPGPPRCGHQL